MLGGNKNKSVIKTYVKKATTRKLIPSKDKHVKGIIMRSFQKDNSNELIIRHLSMRLEKNHWAVILKSLMIFHRCFRDGDSSFIDGMRTKSGQIFSLYKFSAVAPSTHVHTVFVKKYAKYLEEKVSVLRLLGFQFEKNQDGVKNLKTPKCFKIVPKLQSQLNALLNCKMRTQNVGTNPLIHRTYILLMKDSLLLYQLLNEAIIQLLDMFWKMSKKNASKVVSIYKLFVKETDALIGLYEICKRFINQIPEIKKAETSIIDSLEKHIATLADTNSDDDEESGSGEKAAPKKAKKKKQQSSESEEDLKEEDNEYEESDDKDKKYDDDSDEEQDSSSGGEEEPDDLMNFFKGFAQQPITIGPTFGPGAVNFMAPPIQQNIPTYNDKANFIKHLSSAADPLALQPYPNPGVISSTGGNPFAPQPQPNALVNPFQAGLTPQAANPFGGSSLSNPFAAGGGARPTSGITGSSAGTPFSSSSSLGTPFTSIPNTTPFAGSSPTPFNTGNPYNTGGSSPFASYSGGSGGTPFSSAPTPSFNPSAGTGYSTSLNPTGYSTLGGFNNPGPTFTGSSSGYSSTGTGSSFNTAGTGSFSLNPSTISSTSGNPFNPTPGPTINPFSGVTSQPNTSFHMNANTGNPFGATPTIQVHVPTSNNPFL
jgi:hypothetical protein